MSSTGKSRLPLSLRRPRTVLLAALVLIVCLGWVGRHVEEHLNPSSLDVPGTDANRANKILRQYFGDSSPFAILLQGPAEGDRRTGPGARPQASRQRPESDDRLALGQGQSRQPAPGAEQGAGPRRLPRQQQRSRPLQSRRTQRHPRRKGDAAAAGDADRLRDPLEGDPGRIDRRLRALRADRPAGPPARPPARLPLARRRPDPTLLRRDHRDLLTRGADPALRDDLDRRLRPRGQHDDGVSPGRGLRPAHGLPLPRRARQRRRAVRSRRDHPQDRRADDRLRRQHPVPGDGRRDPDPARGAARLAGGHPDGRRDHQRQRRDDRRPGAARPARQQREPLADRQVVGDRPQRRDDLRRRRPAPPDRRRRGDRRNRPRPRHPGHRAEDGAAEHRAAAEQQRRAPGLRHRPEGDRAWLRSALRRRRRDRRRDDDRTRPPRPADQVAAQDRRRPGGAGRDRPRTGGEEDRAPEERRQRTAQDQQERRRALRTQPPRPGPRPRGERRLPDPQRPGPRRVRSRAAERRVGQRRRRCVEDRRRPRAGDRRRRAGGEGDRKAQRRLGQTRKGLRRTRRRPGTGGDQRRWAGGQHGRTVEANPHRRDEEIEKAAART